MRNECRRCGAGYNGATCHECGGGCCGDSGDCREKCAGSEREATWLDAILADMVVDVPRALAAFEEGIEKLNADPHVQELFEALRSDPPTRGNNIINPEGEIGGYLITQPAHRDIHEPTRPDTHPTIAGGIIRFGRKAYRTDHTADMTLLQHDIWLSEKCGE